MNAKFTLPFSLAAAATLAACGGHEAVKTSEIVTPPAVVVTVPEIALAPAVVLPAREVVVIQPVGVVQKLGALRPGFGKVVLLTAPDNMPGTQYVTVRMRDGSSQIFFTRTSDIAMGEHVEITRDAAQVRYPVVYTG